MKFNNEANRDGQRQKMKRPAEDASSRFGFYIVAGQWPLREGSEGGYSDFLITQRGFLPLESVSE